jgi:hypothetical protein
VTAFWQDLKAAGFVEGQNVTIEHRWAAGQNDRLPGLATDLPPSGVTITTIDAIVKSNGLRDGILTELLIIGFWFDPGI